MGVREREVPLSEANRSIQRHFKEGGNPDTSSCSLPVLVVLGQMIITLCVCAAGFYGLFLASLLWKRQSSANLIFDRDRLRVIMSDIRNFHC